MGGEKEEVERVIGVDRMVGGWVDGGVMEGV